ncbi:MAG: DUF3429 domain-containing protein, partial [Cucumibacter sp.]
IVIWAGWAGLIPFSIALILNVFPALSPFDPVILERAVLGYGALTLSFLGGVRWGIRMQGGRGGDFSYLLGIIGAIVGLATLLMPYQLGLAVLIVAFGAQGAWDVLSGTDGGVPKRYSALRITLTLGTSAIVLALFASEALFPA